MTERVDHLGVAVPDLESAISVWRDALGLEVAEIEVVADQRVRVAKMRCGDDVVELLEPTSGDSPIAKFLDRRGGGLHHLCLGVADIEAAIARCKSRGLVMIDDEPRTGAGGCRIAFVHPKSTQGVLVELSEAPR